MKLANRIFLSMLAGIVLGLIFGPHNILFPQKDILIPKGTLVYSDKNMVKENGFKTKKDTIIPNNKFTLTINNSKIYSFKKINLNKNAKEQGKNIPENIFVYKKNISFIWSPGLYINDIVYPFGILFLRLIKMIVIPLVMVSLIYGITSMEDIKKLRKVGMKSFIYFILTTIAAISIGVTLADLIRPGIGINPPTEESISIVSPNSSGNFGETLISMVPENLFVSMVNNNILPILVFSVIFGVALSSIPTSKQKDQFLGILDVLNQIILKIIDFIMLYAPIGVFALIFSAAGKYGYDFFTNIFLYILTVLLGFFTHLMLVYGFSIRFLSKKNFISFLKKVYPVQVIAFATSSSSSTLPVSMEVTEKDLNVPKDTTGFILPLGATINMDGTALYQGVAAIFIAQLYSVDLSLTSQISIILTATIASIGTAGVPGVGIVMLTMVLQSVGLPLSGIGVILGVDRILDMFRTALNVTGDMAAAVYISKE